MDKEQKLLEAAKQRMESKRKQRESRRKQNPSLDEPEHLISGSFDEVALQREGDDWLVKARIC